MNNEVGRWGEALLEADTDRIGEVGAVGVDETLFWRKGRWRTKVWCTSVVDVGGHQLIDIVLVERLKAPQPGSGRSPPNGVRLSAGRC